MIKVILFAATVSFTMPLNYVDGTLLPPGEDLAGVVWRTGQVNAVTALIGVPGEQVSIDIPDTDGCFTATVWTLDRSLQTPLAQSMVSTEYCIPPKKTYGCRGPCHE